MKKIFFVLISLFPLVFVHADNNPEAEKIVKKVVSNLKKSAYQCSFSVIYQDENNKATQNKTGVLQLNNKEFRLVIDDVERKYEGKTQWVYSAENNEVTISEPTKDELKDLNPMFMIDYYVKTHRISLDDNQEKSCDVVNFFPLNPKGVEYFKITIKSYKSNCMPKQLIVWQRNGDKIIFNWEKIEPRVFDKSTFVFNKAEYPNVYENDMR